MVTRRRRLSSEERKKKLSGLRRSLSRRNKELPEELKRVARKKKTRSDNRRKKARKPRTTIYQRLGDIIKQKGGPEHVEISFLEIEEILERPLPPSARKYKAWWANNRSAKATSRHSRAWMEHGYLVTDVNFRKGTVVFTRARGKRKTVPYAAMLIEAARSLHGNKKIPFTRKTLFTEAARLYPRALIHDSALNPVIQAMIEHSNSSNMVADRWRSTFKRVSRGHYQLTPKGTRVDLQKPKIVRVKGKTVKTRLRYYLQANRNWMLEPGTIKPGNGLPALLFDLVSEDRSIAIRILKTRSMKNKDLGRANLFEALYVLEKISSKKKMLVIEEKIGRAKEHPSDYYLKEYGKLMKDVEVFKYVMGNKPEKDELIPVK